MKTANFVPTREEILRACEEIQRTWSDAERMKRRVGSAAYAKAIQQWTAPIYNAEELGGAFRQASREGHSFRD